MAGQELSVIAEQDGASADFLKLWWKRNDEIAFGSLHILEGTKPPLGWQLVPGLMVCRKV